MEVQHGTAADRALADAAPRDPSSIASRPWRQSRTRRSSSPATNRKARWRSAPRREPAPAAPNYVSRFQVASFPSNTQPQPHSIHRVQSTSAKYTSRKPGQISIQPAVVTCSGLRQTAFMPWGCAAEAGQYESGRKLNTATHFRRRTNPPKLLDQIREAARLRHLSLRIGFASTDRTGRVRADAPAPARGAYARGGHCVAGRALRHLLVRRRTQSTAAARIKPRYPRSTGTGARG